MKTMKPHSATIEREPLIISQDTPALERNLQALSDPDLHEAIEAFFAEYKEVHTRLSLPLTSESMTGTLKSCMAAAKVPLDNDDSRALFQARLFFAEQVFMHLNGELAGVQMVKSVFLDAVHVPPLQKIVGARRILNSIIQSYEWPGPEVPRAKLFTTFIILTNGVPSIATDAEKQIVDRLTTYATPGQQDYFERAVQLLQHIRALDESHAAPGLFHAITAGGDIDRAALLRIR